jgi:hypothetical protein
VRGDRSAPRITYLEGCLQIIRPSNDHENLKSLIGCLVEVWCLERDIEFRTVGSWTIEDKASDRVAEVWYWRRGAITVFGLRGEEYEPLSGSEALPGIDLAELASFLDRPTTSSALVHVIAKDDLIAAKRAAGREKDLRDLRALEKE